MCAPPSCHPAAAQAEPGDLHELVQDTSASVSRISSNGESVPRPTSCLWRSSHTGWWVATASPHSAPCSQTPRPLLCPAPPAHTALLHLSPQCLPPPVARVMQASPCREGACESLAQPGRPGPLTGHCGGGWWGGSHNNQAGACPQLPQTWGHGTGRARCTLLGEGWCLPEPGALRPVRKC